jgi:hypothetical protein
MGTDKKTHELISQPICEKMKVVKIFHNVCAMGCVWLATFTFLTRVVNLSAACHELWEEARRWH